MDSGESLVAAGNDVILSLPLPVGPGGRPRQQPPTTTGRISSALSRVMALPDVAEIFVEHIHICVCSATAG